MDGYGAGVIRLHRTGTVPGEPDDVYGIVADVARRPEWLRELRHVVAPAGPVTEGVRFEGQSSLLLHDFIGTSDVVRAEPGRALVEQVVLGARFTSAWTFEAAPGGTLVTHHVDIDFPGGPLGRLERWVLRRRLSVMQRASLEALAQLVRQRQ